MNTANAHVLFFWSFAALTVIPAILAVTVTNNIVRAAFLLMLTFWGVAGLYGLLAADFLLAIQLVVYVGGILVLILFGVMLSRRVMRAEFYRSPATLLMGAAGAGGLGVLAYLAVSQVSWNATPSPASTPTLAPIGELFLGRYVLPFEFVSLLLLAALIGAVILARKEFDSGTTPRGAR